MGSRTRFSGRPSHRVSSKSWKPNTSAQKKKGEPMRQAVVQGRRFWRMTLLRSRAPAWAMLFACFGGGVKESTHTVGFIRCPAEDRRW